MARPICSIVYFYTGASKFVELCQDTVRFGKAFEGYDRRILLREQGSIGNFLLSSDAIKSADEILEPTRANFCGAIRGAAAAGYIIDIFVLAHGSRGLDGTGTISALDGVITGSGLKSDLVDDVGEPAVMPIRLVYQGQAYGSFMRSSWRAVGAKVACGPLYVDFYPTQFGKFVDAWNRGTVPVSSGLEAADTTASRTLVQTFLAWHSLGSLILKAYGGCPFGRTVLGHHSCAREYFIEFWLEEEDWDEDRSGKGNMNYSSQKIVSGNSRLRKNDEPTWEGELAKSRKRVGVRTAAAVYLLN